MNRVIPLYSRSKVNKAGQILVSDTSSVTDVEWAEKVLSNWRACHSYPINTFQAALRQKLGKIDRSAFVAQRLKRTPSIIGKLKRIQGMQLSRMQDIGGLRAVVTGLTKVHALRDDYIKSNFKHSLVHEKNYILEPKKSGYRGIHLIYKYHRKSPTEYNGLLLELQIRTRIQHAWATAVETAGAFLDQALKSSEGEEKWLEFFASAGAAFSYFEATPSVPQFSHLSKLDVYALVSKQSKEIGIRDKLTAFQVAARHISSAQSNDAHYFLLVLDIINKRLSITPFPKKSISIATERYMDEEQRAQGTMNQVVLVSSNSIESLKKAYPNYFLDTHNFIKYLDRIINESEKCI